MMRVELGYYRSIDSDLNEWLLSVSEAMRRAGFRAGLHYNTLEQAILKEGIVFPHDAYSLEEEEILLDVFEDATSFEIKQCFFNAQQVALGDPRLEYAEGFVLVPGLPLAVSHGWNFLPESGKPVDVTLRKMGEMATCDPDELLRRASRNLVNAYRGVVIPTEEIRKRWLKTRRAESFLEDPPVLRKILTKGFPKTWGRAVES